MKKTVLAAFGALLSVVSLHSCLDFDTLVIVKKQQEG